MKKKNKLKNEEHLRDLWDNMKHNNIHIVETVLQQKLKGLLGGGGGGRGEKKRPREK